MPSPRKYYTWFRDHPAITDAHIAAALALIGVLTELMDPPAPRDVYRASSWVSLALTLVATVPVAWRRRWPLPVAVVASVALAVHGGLGYYGAGPALAVVVALYTVAAWGSRRAAVCGLVLGGSAVAIVMALAPEDMHPALVVLNAATYGAAWILGDNMRMRRDYVSGIEERAVRLEAERDERARQAAAEERARIARELHDIVSHNMSVMVVQAGAARRTLDRDPTAAADAMAAIESTGRAALNEMRHMLGVLRTNAGDEDEAPAARAPQPRLVDLAQLLEGCREAGLDVDLQVLGDERPVPTGVQLTVFRVVQEALTNTMKHAGPARATVTLAYDDEVLAIDVSDDGRGAARVDGHTGHGLNGMRERVAVFGGRLDAGPRPGGGYRVHVELPVEAGR